MGGGQPLWTLSPVHSVIDGHPEELAVSVETACPGEPANAQTARDGGAAECTFFLDNAAEVLVPEPTATFSGSGRSESWSGCKVRSHGISKVIKGLVVDHRSFARAKYMSTN